METVFRGKVLDKPIWTQKVTYKGDYRLLSKKEEASYCTTVEREEKLIAPFMEFPPLLKEFVMKETGLSDVKLKVHHKQQRNSIIRLAKDGEKANVEIAMGVGKPHPTATSLYEGLNI